MLGRIFEMSGSPPSSLPPFDPKSFLAKVGEGRSIATYRSDEIVFSQGDAADSVFY
jgi:CRP/FNR family cyclic AMP-dependent transcriptional regulator